MLTTVDGTDGDNVVTRSSNGKKRLNNELLQNSKALTSGLKSILDLALMESTSKILTKSLCYYSHKH